MIAGTVPVPVPVILVNIIYNSNNQNVDSPTLLLKKIRVNDSILPIGILVLLNHLVTVDFPLANCLSYQQSEGVLFLISMNQPSPLTQPIKLFTNSLVDHLRRLNLFCLSGYVIIFPHYSSIVCFACDIWQRAILCLLTASIHNIVQVMYILIAADGYCTCNFSTCPASLLLGNLSFCQVWVSTRCLQRFTLLQPVAPLLLTDCNILCILYVNVIFMTVSWRLTLP